MFAERNTTERAAMMDLFACVAEKSSPEHHRVIISFRTTDRDNMKHKIIRAIPLLAGAFGIAVALLAAPQAANAAGGPPICETSGAFCIGAPTLSTDAAVTETASGRQINMIAAGAGVELQINAAPSLCVAVTNNNANAVLHPCNGGAGVVWNKNTSTGHLRFQDQEFGTWLAGRDNGTQFTVKPLGVTGFFYNFDQA
jgi:hypothetical protein